MFISLEITHTVILTGRSVEVGDEGVVGSKNAKNRKKP